MGFSIAAPCYNEGPRLKRFILSSLAIRGVEEIFIVDHRSDDNSLDILKELQDVCKSRGVALKWITETRDFCREFTMADLRQVVVKGCSNKIVHMLDADMVLGPSYSYMARSCERIFNVEDDVYCIGYEIPCVRESIKINDNRVIDLGACIMHPSIPRVFLRDCIDFKQNREGGKFYWGYSTEPNRNTFKIIPRLKDSLVSVDIKPERYKTNNDRDPLGLFFGEIFKDEKIKNIKYLDYIKDYRAGKYPVHTRKVLEETQKSQANFALHYNIKNEYYFFEDSYDSP